MNKIKIIQFITGLNTGGAEMVVKDLVLNLDKKKYELLVVSILPIGQIGKMIKNSGIKVISLNAKFKYNPIIIFKFFKLLKKEKPQIIHSHLFHADIIGKIVGKICKVPVIINTHHSTNMNGKFREKVINLTKNLVNFNIAVSNQTLKIITKKRLINNNYKIIYNGISIKNFPYKNKNYIRKNLNINENAKLGLLVGRLIKEKGYIYLIEAVEKLKNNFLFIILGEGSERHFLENEIRKRGLENKIILKGNVSNVNDYLQAADFFLIPSLYEGFSLALLEAAVSEKIIITTKVGIALEIIENNKTGFLIKRKNSQEIADKINYILNLPEQKKKQIEKNVKKIVEHKFSIEKMINEHERLYDNLFTSHTN